MITSVGSASKSPPVQRPQNPTAGSTQPDQNDPKHKANRTGYFFNNIGHERPNCDGRVMSALHPEAGISLRRDRRRFAPIATSRTAASGQILSENVEG